MRTEVRKWWADKGLEEANADLFQATDKRETQTINPYA
jgi:hypothetical protein